MKRHRRRLRHRRHKRRAANQTANRLLYIQRGLVPREPMTATELTLLLRENLRPRGVFKSGHAMVDILLPDLYREQRALGSYERSMLWGQP